MSPSTDCFLGKQFTIRRGQIRLGEILIIVMTTDLALRVAFTVTDSEIIQLDELITH